MVETQVGSTAEAPRRAPSMHSASWERAVGPVVAALTVGVILAAGWRGADWPAQIFRIETFRTDGFTLWNNLWYGGHHSVGYSLLLPPMATVLGVGVVCVGSAAIATWAMGDLLVRLRPRRLPVAVATTLFGVTLAANVAVGRLPFLLGCAVALSALVAWSRGRLGLALVLAFLSGLASPVAALFLGIVAGGCALPHWRQPTDLLRFSDVRGRGPLVALVAMGPVLAIAWVFPAGGSFPFAVGGCLLSLAALGAVAWASESDDLEVRATCAVTAVATVVAFVLPTPLGGNIVRLPMFFALPVLVVLMWERRRRLLVPVALLLVVWAWWPAVDAVMWAADDPTAEASFFAPMIVAVSEDAEEPARVEIPFTKRHWEAAHVAPYLPLARGWERQLDRRLNPVFYEDEPLTSLGLYVWLRDNAVRYVALPDAELDPSAEQEAALLEEGQPYLRPVWENENWQVWEVTRGGSLVRGQAELLDLTADSVELDVTAPGDVLVRVRYSPHWAVDGPSCVVEDPDGWTLLHVADAGPLTMIISPDALAGVGDESADPCDPEVLEELAPQLVDVETPD